MKHVLIGGTSFCGSTVMSLILGTAKGAENVSESHWLVPFDRKYLCRYCNGPCAYWTRRFRKDLEADQTDWYPRLADRLQTDILISADKTKYYIDMLDPAHDHTALVLYKSPGNFWHSIKKRRWKTDDLAKTLNRWTRIYEEFFDESYKPLQGKVFLNVERFMADPERTIPILFDVLGLKGRVPDAKRYWAEPQHYMGGNFNAYQRLKEKGEEAMKLRPVGGAPESVAEAAKLSDHPAHVLHANLQERCILAGAI